MIGGADASVVFGYVVATDSDGAEERGEIPPPSVDEMRFAAALGWRSSALAWQAPAPVFVLVVAAE